MPDPAPSTLDLRSRRRYRPAMLLVEAVAAFLIVINVALVALRSIWNYAFGIVGVIVYGWFFYHQRLYSDALLQVFFLVAQVYGVVGWSRNAAAEGEVTVGRLSTAARWRWVGGIVLASVVWGTLMHRYTDAASPWLDAAVAMTSIAAQLLMAQRRVENWWLWVAVNLLSITLYASRGIWITFVLYLALLMVSLWGLARWRRAESQRIA